MDELIAKHPFPKKAYRLFQKKNGVNLNANFTDMKIQSLEKVLEKLFAEKGCEEYAKVRIQNNRHMIGLMLEHATPENHYSTLDTKGKPMPSYSTLRLRVSDFVWVDKYNKMLWIKSTLMTKATKNRFLEALGIFLCDDLSAFINQHSPNMSGFNSPSLESNLKGYDIPGIKKVELREFYYRKVGVTSGNEHQMSGPSEKGCVTELPNWIGELPAQWQTSSVNLIFETISGDREAVSFTSRSINIDHTPNLPLAIALLKHLKVIPNNDN